jgi:hypothetical protein
MTTGDEFDTEEALAFYRTLPEKEILRRQDLCLQQIIEARRQCSKGAIENPRKMGDALFAVLLERAQVKGRVTEKHVQEAADAIALRDAASILARRSRKPGSFWLKVIIRVLNKAAEAITEGKDKS